MTITSPSFGNSWTLDFQVINRHTLDGTPKSVRDDAWPVIEELRMVFQNLAASVKDTFVSDIDAAFGTEITLTDFEGVDWIGCIIEDVTITESLKLCGYDVTFNFQGIKQP